MTPEQRIADTDQVRCEIASDVWYTSSFRWRQWQASFEAHQFGWFVSEVRRVGGGEDMWQVIADKLTDWESEIEQ